MNRLQDLANATWPVGELNGYLSQAIKSLYPNFWLFKTATTVATDGPLQTNPTGGRNFYFIGLQRIGSTRVRLMRQWKEGDTSTYIPKTGITGQTLVWAWTTGFTPPAGDGTTLDIPDSAEEIVVLRTQITALERILTTRVESAKYFALTVREGVTEQDVLNTLDALHASVANRLENAIKRPERVG